ncbi:MAG: response regulator [Patescibacteria group bacterium]
MEKEKIDTSRKYVLIVEDDSFLRSLITQKFTQEGFEVFGAVTGKEGIEKINDRMPDIILLDILLPDINGFDVLAYVKKDEMLRDIPVLIISNLSDQEDLERAQKLGAKEFLIKANISTTEIVNKVRETLAGK